MQVLLNVVGNAVKFCKQGSILVSALVAKSEFLRDPQAPVITENHFYLRVQVKDTGVGINPLDIPKIFSKFAQNQSLAGGSGLGLAICKSEGHGKGATAIFIVKLGIPGLSNELKPTLVPKLPANHIHTIFLGLKVLLVDDNRHQNYRFLLLFQHALGGFLDTELLRRDWKMKLTPYEI
nr:ethylene receptor 1 isoform X2 [Ipomoea trifida]